MGELVKLIKDDDERLRAFGRIFTEIPGFRDLINTALDMGYEESPLESLPPEVIEQAYRLRHPFEEGF